MNKTYTRNLLLMIIVASIINFSCRKNDIQIIIPDNSNPDLVTKVTTTISGFVTNENDEAMPGAIVRVGSAFLNTDQFGYFEIKNVEVNETAATFSVSKVGYFKLTKTFMAKEGKGSFFRVKLSRRDVIGTIDAANGGNVSLSNGTTISLPANGVKSTSTGASYTGAISVYSHYIDPTAADIAGIMPGDLRGLRTNGDLNVLDSYGMLEVELTGASGELLQIADGKKATLTMAIPSSLTATAPATIPLWYFDETTGLWKEEGTANKVGNQYVGEVSHFSTWNCDNPKPHVPYHCRLVYSDGSPASNVEVKLIEENYYGGGTNHGFTDENGEIFGGVQANAQVRMEVRGLAFQNCVLLLNQTFTTSSTPIDMGELRVNSNSINEANISGSVNDCNNLSLSDGKIFLEKNGYYEIHYCNSNGEFNFRTYLCGSSVASQIYAQDLITNSFSNPIYFQINSGNNVVPAIRVCDSTALVTICGQTWMTRDLIIDHYRNGDIIPNVLDELQWANLTTGACYKETYPININGVTYMYTFNCYNWYALNDPRGFVPAGYHIPSDSEWTSLENCLGGAAIAGGALKDTGTAFWASPNVGATNSSGFSARCAEMYRDFDGQFLNGAGFWWSSTDSSSTSAYSRYLVNNSSSVFRFVSDKNFGFAVRLIKD